MESDLVINKSILPRSKWWWLGLALLLLLAGWLYLRGYDAGLPYFDQFDEAYHLAAAQHMIDFGTARTFQNHDAYPPGMNTLNYLLLKHVKPEGAHHGAVVPIARLISISTWLTTVVIIALLGYLLVLPTTGLTAAAIWIVNPWVVQRAHFAFPDGYLTLFTLLGLWLALAGTLHFRRGFSTAAVYSIVLAACFKTQAIFLAPLVIVLPLVNWWRAPTFRTEAKEQVFWNCVRFGFFLFWYVLLTRTLEGGRTYPFPLEYSNFALPALPVLWANLEQVLRSFWKLDSWLAVALLGTLLWRYRHQVNGISFIIVSLAALAWLFGLSLFGTRHIRQFFALGALLVLLNAAALSSLLLLAEDALARLEKRRVSPGLLLGLAHALLSLLLAIGLLPAFRASDALTYDYTLPDRRNDLAKYMDTSLPPGVSAGTQETHAVFLRDVGGYTGIHDFPLYTDDMWSTGLPTEKWRNQGVEYAVMPFYPLLEDPGVYQPDETVLLKSYPPDPSFRDPSMVVLRLYPMQKKTEGQLGPIRLLGYDINGSQFDSGEEIVFRHYWQAKMPTKSIHHIYNHLLNSDSEIVAQVDYVPLWDDRRPTTTWDDPDEIMLGREFELSLPADLPSGEYTLATGLYDPQTGSRLTSADGADHAIIAEIAVTRAGR